MSILRTIAVRHPIDLSLALDASSVLLSGKSSAQITNSVMRMISKSIAELSFQMKNEKKNKKNKKKGRKSESEDGDSHPENELSFSINQIHQTTEKPTQKMKTNFLKMYHSTVQKNSNHQ